ncbi:hypothetical protein U0070_002132 [Myodes glareolus]|uniref:Uncharacterized protein n=1 Tax=Myodes glareolus TaxID=447135 RepID=A0AAW0JPH9_MYOGA
MALLKEALHPAAEIHSIQTPEFMKCRLEREEQSHEFVTLLSELTVHVAPRGEIKELSNPGQTGAVSYDWRPRQFFKMETHTAPPLLEAAGKGRASVGAADGSQKKTRG